MLTRLHKNYIYVCYDHMERGMSVFGKAEWKQQHLYRRC